MFHVFIVMFYFYNLFLSQHIWSFPHRYMVSVPSCVSGLLGSDPSVGGGGSTEPADQGGSLLRVATCYNSYVNKQV